MVTIDSRFVAPQVWRIDATLRFGQGLAPQPGDELYDRGRVALVEAIVREGIRGRALGATTFRARLDASGTIQEFDLGSTLADFAS